MLTVRFSIYSWISYADFQDAGFLSSQVVQWLLANNYLLTAFELLVEAQESGKEADLGFLKEFFSDRIKFPPDEISQFDQDDGRCTKSVCLGEAVPIIHLISQGGRSPLSWI